MGKIQDGGSRHLRVRFLKIYIGRKWRYFPQNWYTDRYWALKGTVAQHPTFSKIQDGGTRHLEFSIFGHIWVADEDIFVKLGTLIDIGHSGASCGPISKFWQNYRWRQPPSSISILKIYIGRKWRYFSQNWYTDRYWPLKGYSSPTSHF